MKFDVSSWLLTVIICAAAVLCGLKPAIISHIVLIGGLLLCFAWRDQFGKFSQTSSVSCVLIGAALAWIAASLQWSLLPARGMYDLLVLIVLSAVMLQIPFGIHQLQPAAVDKIIHLFIAAAMIGILCYVMDTSLNLIWQRTLAGAAWDKHLMLAAISRNSFCILLLLWSVIYYGWRREWHLFVFFLWVVSGIALILSDSAAGRLAYFISTIIFLVASRWPQLVRITLAAVMIAGFALAVPAAQITQDMLEATGKKISGSFIHRSEIWKFTAARILEKPVTGWGFDSSRAVSNGGQVSKYQNYDPMKSIIPMHPHNWILHILLELGLIGGILMMAIWLWLLHQISQLHRAVQPMALTVYSIAMVVGAFSIGAWQGWWLAALIFSSIIIQLFNHEAHRTRQ